MIPLLTVYTISKEHRGRTKLHNEVDDTISVAAFPPAAQLRDTPCWLAECKMSNNMNNGKKAEPTNDGLVFNIA
jgi:hypothetical protein